MKILITGAYGMLGSDLRDVLSSHDVIAAGSKDLDITDCEKVLEFVKENSPDIVINAAAYTAVDDCETNFDEAYQVNAIGPRNLAIAPLVENDPIGPKSAYGKTKLEGEKFIEEILDKYFILRTAWLYGLNGPNFVKTMLALTESYDEVTVVYDQVGSPTYTHDLALAISELLESDKYGIYHLTNAGECSWYEYCMEFYALAGKDTKVKPVTTEEFPRPAPRPHYSVLSNEKWIKAGFTPMRSYKEALKDYLNLIL